MRQMLLFPDPKPLVERLGVEFFRSAPACPGVYLMRDAADSVLYVGKAKNLRKRLGSYRVANPNRMKRRQLRLLRAVSRIELLACESEDSALARESELLRNLRPKFNRAGTWPGPKRFLLWRIAGAELEIGVGEIAAPGWQAYGPMGSSIITLRDVLARLLWRVAHPEMPVCNMPVGWWHGRFESRAAIAINSSGLLELLNQILSEVPEPAIERLLEMVSNAPRVFDKAAMALDLEWLIAYISKKTGRALEPVIRQ